MAAQPVPKVMKQGKLAPWLYLAPSLVIMTIFIVYPMINTIGLSFLNKDGTASAATTCVAGKACWGIFENYHYALTSELNTSSFGSSGLRSGNLLTATPSNGLSSWSSAP